jgi:hypothetical protein
MDAVEAARSGHPGMPMDMADVATILFGEFLKFDPADPAWPPHETRLEASKFESEDDRSRLSCVPTAVVGQATASFSPVNQGDQP